MNSRMCDLAAKLHSLIADEREAHGLLTAECVGAIALVQTVWAGSYNVSLLDVNNPSWVEQESTEVLMDRFITYFDKAEVSKPNPDLDGDEKQPLCG